ncbi:Mov34/MPN/PAD-1 family protein [Ralstonia solanacearum]|uniref:Mov34/MPN/PAD-1 family protein n=1 Tax=Ralstonia solanacearum TaxID=305 RepID=UPI00078D3ADA|nr:M67 family metallopeptidase [Ralstonia solanacearum]AMP39912.1 peptidase [Ralstonia solanacearum]AXV88755.1 peptidase [Ralstonia solanacearum]AXW08226.1 peptidase [Ralstonia solanacearum]AXW26016.1 peptidase [Ralstonia solanacearum]AXW82926.1 peptidase [Ralstonia solanacearum]
MLIILSEFVDAILAQARRDHPVESCGVITGPAGSDCPMRLIPMRNAAQSPDAFHFDPQEQLQVWRTMEARGEEPIVLYHSHTSTGAYPSRDDVRFAAEPQAHYLIVSTAPACQQTVRSFRIADGKAVEETIRTVERYNDVPIRSPSLKEAS